MGGQGSGVWVRRNTKTTTDGLLRLDVNWLAREGFLVPGATGTLHWTDSFTYRPMGRVAFSVRSSPLPDVGLRVLRLSYCWNASESVTESIELQATQPHFGGERWWLTCPLRTDGKPCNRRVGKLYLKDGRFGCRFCHELTYRSCQESHKSQRMFDRVTRLFGPMPVPPALVRNFERWLRSHDDH